MKTIDELTAQEPVYVGDFRDAVDVIAHFEGIFITKDEYLAEEAPYPNEEMWVQSKEDFTRAAAGHAGEHIIFAYYSYEDYSGEAFVVFEKDGMLYEVNGGHCSCYGLEGQWNPEETSLKALDFRYQKGTLGFYNHGSEKYATILQETLGLEAKIDQ